MANTKVTQHVIANNAITADQIASAAVTDAKLHSTLDLSGKTLTLPATAIPSASTATTQAASDNTTKLATTAYVTTAIGNLVDSAPTALDTLNELAAALGDDANFSGTITTSLAGKLPLAGGTMTGDIVLSGAPTSGLHPATKTYTDTADALKLNLSGGTLTGDLILNTTTALQIPVGTTGQRPTAVTGQIRWNSTDGAIEVYNGTAWTAVGTGSSNKVLDTFTGDGSNATFTLSVTPANEDAIMVFIDGAYQEKSDYVLTNNSLVLDTAPLLNEKIAVHITTASVHDGTTAVNQQFTATAGQTDFTLSQDPKSENNTQVYINGVYQQKTDYTVTGTTLAFDTGLTVGDVVEVNMFTVATLGNTDTVNEGVSNLYHTTARARGAISVSGNAISYNSSTGVLSANFEEGPVFTSNVGIGVTPDTLSSGYSSLQINGYAYLIGHSGGDHYMTNNAYYNSGWKYGQTSTAQKIELASGRISLMTAASGSADSAITWNTGLVQDSTGKVGIGTTSPADYTYGDLVIDGAGDSAGISLVSNTNGYGGIFFADGTSGSEKYRGFLQYNHNYSSHTDKLLFGTGGATNMVLDGSGKLGIGTENPGGKLHVQMAHTATDVTLANSNETLVLGNSGTGNGVYNAIKFGGNQQDMYIMSFNHNAAASRRMGFFLGSVAGDAVDDERLSILGNGNVGVGVAVPAAKLTVAAPATDRETIRLGTYYSPVDSLSRGGITWHDGGHITGQIDTRYDGTTVDMHIGSLYSSGYNTTSKMIVKGNGIIETPLQPSFNAYHSSGSMSIAAGGKFIFNSTHHNVGNMYNTSTGRITVPVAGTYLLTFHTIFQGNYGNAYFQFYINNARSTVIGDYHLSKNDTNTAYWQTHQFSRVVKLAKNDYIDIFARNTLQWHGTHWGGLSCHLL